MPSSIFAIIFTLYLCIVPAFFYIILYRTETDTLQTLDFQSRCGSLYSDIKTQSKMALLTTFLFLFRRLALAITIICLQFSPALQAFMIITQSFLMLVFIISVQPYTSRRTYYFEIFNEVTALIVSYFTAVNAGLLTDVVMRQNVGWFLTGLILFNILANFLNIFIKIGSQLYGMIKKVYLSKCKKAQKSQVYVESEEIANVAQVIPIYGVQSMIQDTPDKFRKVRQTQKVQAFNSSAHNELLNQHAKKHFNANVTSNMDRTNNQSASQYEISDSSFSTFK